MTIRYARLETSPRLQKALAVLKANPKGLTTWEWIHAARICNCNTVKAELLAQGIAVSCRSERNPNGKGIVYRYTLEGAST
ncbi:MAG TPA: hypothetical protein VK465_07035 [Fibrobacteria bacterium]|nr:hypothetical protein [Fibrobacteria bacterium]